MRVSVDGQCLSAHLVDPAARRFVWQLIAAFTRSAAGIEMETLTLDAQVAEALRMARLRVRLLDLPEPADRPTLQSYAQRVNHAFRIAWLDLPPDIILLPDIISSEIAFIDTYSAIPVVALLYSLPKGVAGSPEYDRFVRKIQRLREVNAWFLVSSLALRDYLSENRLVPSDRIETISSPVDLQRFAPPPETLSGREAEREPRVLTLADERTLEALPTVFAAFAGLSANLGKTRLTVVADTEDESITEAVKKAASEEGVDPRRWEFAPDEEEVFASLLRSAQCFIYPAIEDHIGTPLLQALASGCPTICTESGALPELAGTAALAGSPFDVDAIRERIVRFLRQASERDNYSQRGQVRARKYSGRQCAARLVQTFHQEYRAEAGISGDLRAAYVSPFPPVATGVANYSNHLARELRDYADLHLYTADKEDLDAVLKTRFPIYALEELPARYVKYDIVIYNMAARGDLFQPYIDLMARFPGVVVLHDINLHNFFYTGQSYANGRSGVIQSDPYFREMQFCYGAAGAEAATAELTAGVPVDPDREFLNNRLTRRSRGVIVHSQWAANKLLENGDSSPVLVVPHGAQIDPQYDQVVSGQVREMLRRKGEFAIAASGFFNRHWRIRSLLHAVARLKQSGVRVVLMLMGDLTPEARRTCEELSAELGINDLILEMGFIKPYDAYLGHLAAVDVVIDMRGSESGGTSGAAMAAMALGKPAIVGDVPQNRELPSRAIFKVPFNDMELPTLSRTLEMLAKNQPLRQQVGQAGRAYVNQTAAWPLVARRISLFLYEIARRYRYAPAAE